MSMSRIHGGIDPGEFERLGFDPATMLDFSVNSNPYGPSPAVWDALRSVDLSRYPDRACLDLRRLILTHELADIELAIDTIVCGNGAAELIWAIARAMLAPGKRAVILGPTFGEYSVACEAAGAEVRSYPAHPLIDVAPDRDAITAWLEGARPALVWLCNPNNPTGHWWSENTVRGLAETCRTLGAHLVIDEAYWRFLVPVESFSAVHLVPDGGVTVIRALTKDFALAGLRLGYLVTNPTTADTVRAQLPSWNVSGPAQAVGVAALRDREHLNTTLTALSHERHAFFAALSESGSSVVPSRTHYCLIAVGNAKATRSRLLTRGLLVRDCASFGLPCHIRVATRLSGEWQKLVAALIKEEST